MHPWAANQPARESGVGGLQVLVHVGGSRGLERVNPNVVSVEFVKLMMF